MATSAQEVPLYLPLGEDHLFGVATYPTVPTNRVGVLVLGGRVSGAERNATYVRLARRLAARGYTTLRIDYRGVGDSSGEVMVWDLERPFTADALAGVAWLREHGAREIVLVGHCGGGRAALAAAERVPELKGLALLAVPATTYTGMSRSALWHLGQALRLRTLRRMLLPEWRTKYVRIVQAWVRRKVEPQPENPGDQIGRAHV